MGLTLEAARRLWESLPLPVDEGLAPAELRRVEKTLGFEFNPDHRVLLAAGLPLGGRWPDWRDPAGLKERLAEPVEGVLFDVAENGFWWRGWGRRPSANAEAVLLAHKALAEVPTLVPVYGHRYTPALPEPGLPVLSVVQTDVVVYGSDLADYLVREFGSAEGDSAPAGEVRFWTEIS